MVKSLLKKIPIVKTVANEHSHKFPLLDEVLTKIDPLKDLSRLGYGTLFCDGEMIGHEYYPEVVKKKIYLVLDCKIENDTFIALVKTVGVILIQDIFLEKNVILKVFKTDNLKSEKTTVVTGFFDQWYLRQYPETLFFGKKPEHKKWDLPQTTLFSPDLYKMEDLIQTKPYRNCEFKV